MTEYRRHRLKGGCYFFTVNLAERNRTLLTDRIELLRESFLNVKNQHPFNIDAMVVLPEQRRFWEHRIRNEDDFVRHVDYIHYNPVKHGYVRCVADWRYSSFHDFVRRGILPANWAGGIYPELDLV